MKIKFSFSLQTESDFASLSLHEATPEEKENAEKLKNKGNLFYFLKTIKKRLRIHNLSSFIGAMGPDLQLKLSACSFLQV